MLAATCSEMAVFYTGARLRAGGVMAGGVSASGRRNWPEIRRGSSDREVGMAGQQELTVIYSSQFQWGSR